ncbi:hypothetical protein Nmul_A2169 [Nitrosospira multiformis ATCC 25196]|uniref:Uncharacterized protein n=1 Tax=Nitrosospira multiformis (strain ATCC 25196 / NCIMB 11849 / C 71) TaxID=323848 RepID=Q2Y709_NITMU|nr:hypothetical protein Nmul_A2169 [Nitrosospira multiformis ATCC 25196]
MQRNKLLSQDFSSVINSDLGPLPLPTSQLAPEFLSLNVSDITYLINSCYGFLRFVFLRLRWNNFMFLFFISHISLSSPLDKNKLCSNGLLRPAVSPFSMQEYKRVTFQEGKNFLVLGIKEVIFFFLPRLPALNKFDP